MENRKRLKLARRSQDSDVDKAYKAGHQASTKEQTEAFKKKINGYRSSIESRLRDSIASEKTKALEIAALKQQIESLQARLLEGLDPEVEGRLATSRNARDAIELSSSDPGTENRFAGNTNTDGWGNGIVPLSDLAKELQEYRGHHMSRSHGVPSRPEGSYQCFYLASWLKIRIADSCKMPYTAQFLFARLAQQLLEGVLTYRKGTYIIDPIAYVGDVGVFKKGGKAVDAAKIAASLK